MLSRPDLWEAVERRRDGSLPRDAARAIGGSAGLRGATIYAAILRPKTIAAAGLLFALALAQVGCATPPVFIHPAGSWRDRYAGLDCDDLATRATSVARRLAEAEQEQVEFFFGDMLRVMARHMPRDHTNKNQIAGLKGERLALEQAIASGQCSIPAAHGPPPEKPAGQINDSFTRATTSPPDPRRLDQAVRDYNRALARNPADAAALNGRGSARLVLGHYDAALADFEAAIRIDPADARAIFNRGRVYFGLQRFDRAMQDYDRAISLDPALREDPPPLPR